jgi:adenylosuccinate synthase
MVGLSGAKICGASEWCNQLMMMKEMYSGFETLKVCTRYNYKGKKLPIFLITLSRKCNSLPKFKGWKQDLTGMTT